MNEKLIADLKRRLARVAGSRNTDNYFMAVMEFHSFIGSSSELQPVIAKLIRAEKIPPIELKELFNDFIFNQTLTRVDTKPAILDLPNFFNEEVEKTYSLFRKFLELHGITGSHQKGDLITLDPKARVIHPKLDGSFYHIQKLYDDIIETLEDEEMAEQESEEIKESIKSLAIVEASPDDKKIKIVINEDYNKPIKGDRKKHVDEFLYQIAKKIPMSVHKWQSQFDLINYNADCKLYSKTSYKPTPILQKKGEFFLAAIPMEIIPESTYKKLKTKKK